jgi:hypothetical protein
VSLTIQCILACILACILPCILACIRHPIRSTSSVESYLRSNLTADSRTSLVPAMFHFYSLFYYFHSISFHIDVREIYEVQCVLSYGVSFTIHCVVYDTVCLLRYTSPLCINPATIPGDHPRCVSRHNSGTHSVLHLRSILTFGHILPRILEQVLCPRYSTFISIFITFIY